MEKWGGHEASFMQRPFNIEKSVICKKSLNVMISLRRLFFDDNSNFRVTEY